jgi:hypothetical protein
MRAANKSLLTLLIMASFCPMAAMAAEDAALTIIRRSVSKDQANWQLSRDYTYLKRTEEHELDSSGQVKSVESKTVEVSILYGERYRRLIRKNDRPLSADDQAKEEAKLKKFADERQHESEQDKAKRIARVAKERERQRAFLREVPDAFVFKQLHDELIEGRPVFVIEAEPKPNYSPELDEARILKKVRAKFWVDKSEYQWVKAEAEILDTISYGLFLVRVERGSHFLFEQVRINNEIWLPKHQHEAITGRIGLVKKIRMDIDATYTNYRKFVANAKIVSPEGK